MPKLYDMLPESRRKMGMWWSEAWSLIHGCSAVSPGCDHCWAERLTHVRARNPNRAVSDRHVGLTTRRGKWRGGIRIDSEQLGKPYRKQKPQVFAVWNDLFHKDVPDGFRDRVFDTMRRTPHHAFVVLTKRPEIMSRYIADKPVVPNVILGTSIEDAERAKERMPHMRKIMGYRAGPRWLTVLCFEPLVGQIKNLPGPAADPLPSWVIVGAERCGAAPGRPMEGDWARLIRNNSERNRVPFWFKAWGNGVLHLDERRWLETPEIPEAE